MLQRTPVTEAPPPKGEAAARPESSELAAILQAGSGRGRSRRWLIAGLVLLMVLAGLWFAFGRSSGGDAVTYATTPVTRGDLTVAVTATGTVQPTNTVDISSELSGTVATVDVGFNDRVTAGQTLATLKPEKLESAVQLAEATLTAREADVRQAEATVAETAAARERTATLAGRELASQSSNEQAAAAYTRALASVDVANANRDVARANLSMAEADLANATIVAPIDGVILNRTVEVGQTVAASTSAPVLFTLAEDLAQMELQVDIDEADVGKVTEGDSATFRVEAFGSREFPAEIAQVRLSPATVEGVVSYKAILTVDNADLALRPGMTATADITVDEVDGALLVPNSALRYAPPASAGRRSGSGLLGLLMPSPPQRQQPPPSLGAGERTLYVLRDGAPVGVPVVTGVTDGTRTEIVSGDLNEGDQVITASRAAAQ